MLTINFSYNWNHKLDCDFFTTIRLSKIHNVGDIVIIKCQNRKTDTGQIVSKIVTKLDKLTDYVCYSDTGYSKQITIELIKKMYKGVNDWTNQDIILYGILRKYKGKQETIIDALHEDGIINKNSCEPIDQFVLDFMEYKENNQ